MLRRLHVSVLLAAMQLVIYALHVQPDTIVLMVNNHHVVMVNGLQLVKVLVPRLVEKVFIVQVVVVQNYHAHLGIIVSMVLKQHVL